MSVISWRTATVLIESHDIGGSDCFGTLLTWLWPMHIFSTGTVTRHTLTLRWCTSLMISWSSDAISLISCSIILHHENMVCVIQLLLCPCYPVGTKFWTFVLLDCAKDALNFAVWDKTSSNFVFFVLTWLSCEIQTWIVVAFYNTRLNPHNRAIPAP